MVAGEIFKFVPLRTPYPNIVPQIIILTPFYYNLYYNQQRNAPSNKGIKTWENSDTKDIKRSDAPMDPVSVTDAKPERRLQESVGNESFLDTQRKLHVEGTYGDDIRSAWRRREKGLMQPASLGRTIAVT